MVCCGFPAFLWFHCYIVPNAGGVCGDLWWFSVVCGGLRWFVMVCGGLS